MLTTCMDNVLPQQPSSGIVIAGDFNQLKLKELCNRFNLKKSVKKPTRGQNTLDQILTNMLFLTLSIISLHSLKEENSSQVQKNKTEVPSKFNQPLPEDGFRGLDCCILNTGRL